MAGLIPENILEDILSRVNIVEVISGYIPLKRAGRNFKAVCPFHHEKTPSFMVSPDRQIYHCFGCQASGNAFKFLMSYERLEFPEAVEILAKKCGVILPQDARVDSKTESLHTQLYKINELAAAFYQENLDLPQCSSARDYFLKRGVKNETIKLFKLGIALDKWDALICRLRSKNIGLSLLEKAGLVLPRENGGFYDRFRNRIIFPIFDLRSRALGFGARVFLNTDKSAAKYINSPETPVYIKGRNLYGFNYAKDAIRDNDCAVIVEGYLDFILPYQEGFRNLVASQGTALTVEQVNLLKRYTHNVVMVYDSDDAGQAATLRSLDIFIEEGMSVKVVSLPPGLDPDLYVREYGAEGLRSLISQAEGLFEYKLKNARSRYDQREIEGKVKIIQEMLPSINKFKNAVLKSEYIKKLAEELQVKEEALQEEIKKMKGAGLNAGSQAIQQKSAPKANPTEELLLKLMLEEKSFIEHIRQHLEPHDFQDERFSRIVSILFDLAGKGKDVELNKLIHNFTDAESLRFICGSAFDLDVPADNMENVVNDCIKRIKQRKIVHDRLRLQDEISIAEKSGNEDRLNQLRAEFCQLLKEDRIKNGKKDIYQERC